MLEAQNVANIANGRNPAQCANVGENRGISADWLKSSGGYRIIQSEEQIFPAINLH
jgi:hypothetical protein